MSHEREFSSFYTNIAMEPKTELLEQIVQNKDANLLLEALNSNDLIAVECETICLLNVFSSFFGFFLFNF